MWRAFCSLANVGRFSFAPVSAGEYSSISFSCSRAARRSWESGSAAMFRSSRPSDFSGHLREHVRLPGVFILQARALVDGVPQAHFEADQPQHARRIVVERIIVNRPQLFPLDVADAVGGIHQQTQRRLIERQRHRVHREIPAAQIFVDGGRLDGGFARRTSANRSERAMAISTVTPPSNRSCVDFLASSVETTIAAVLLVRTLTSLAGLPSTVKSRSRTGNPPSTSRIAPPVRYKLRPGSGRGRLHLAHQPILFPGQVAFQHEHVVAHSVLASLFAPRRGSHARG